MGLLKKVIVIYLTFFTLIIFLQSCCEEKFKIIGKGEIGAYNDYYNLQNKTDTVKREFLIVWKLEQRTASIFNRANLIQSCYATSCDETFENELIESSFSILSNREFIFNGSKIAPNTDLSKIEELDIEISNIWGFIQVRFSEAFINKSSFENGEYEFILFIKTTDNMDFENKLKIIIEF